MLPVIGELRPWADPEITGIGRLPMRPPSVAFGDVASARSGDRSASPWWRSLDGRWRVRWFDDVDAIPPSAVRTVGSSAGPPDLEGWTTARVPGNWTVQRVGREAGDLPHYTNVAMPFPGPPPRLPDRLPAVVYQRTFTVSRRWVGRRVVVHVGGAESVHAVFVNGHFCGYGTDSRLASEYDVTEHVTPGRNDLAIVVVRWSAHSYVEDQDQWWMAGLHREVTVSSRSSTALVALVCTAGVRAAGADRWTGTLTVRATVGGVVPPAPGWSVRTWLETLDGEPVAAAQTHVVPHRFEAPYVFTGHRTEAHWDVDDVAPWSAESPSRYRVVAEVLAPDGEVTEVHSQLVGFRAVEVRGGHLLVNGRPILVFGVNRHDHHPDRGAAQDLEDLRADLLEMRRHNISAVRCSHYPNDPRFLDLCDELGMYVVDEANIESHAYNTSLCHNPRFRPTWMARGSRMVERDRNHPSVVMWSLGNESGDGEHHDALGAWIRRVDPTRPLHYEGGVFHSGWDDGGRGSTDVVCPMYPTIDAIAAYRGDRPLIMCEYNHAMGNSNGGLADYWDVIDASFRSGGPLQGGFLWEWKDHGLTAELPSGRRGFAHGGHFGDEPNDGNFVADGLVSSDLVPHPGLREVAWAYRPVVVERSGRRRLLVRNRRSFSGLDDLAANWELLVDGEVVGAGELGPPVVPPLGSVAVALPVEPPEEVDPSSEVHLTVRWRTREATPWAPAGHLVAWDQVELRRAKRRHTRRGGAATPVAAAGADDGAGGPLSDVVTAPIELCIARAPVDNDGFKLMPDMPRPMLPGETPYARWQRLGVYDMPADELVEHDHRVTLLDDGVELHEHRIVVPAELDDLARIGVTFRLRAGFDRIRWFGRGPGENYPDRRRGSSVGVWESGVDEPPYLVPQEFGLRTDCRWFECRDASTGDVVRVEAVVPHTVHCSATHFTVFDLLTAAHETDLRPRRELVVHVDAAHRGLGTASCGPDALPRDRVAAGHHRLTYRIGRRRSGGGAVGS